MCFPAFAATVPDTAPGSDSTVAVNPANQLLEKDQLIRSYLVEEAKQFMGLNYRYGGTSPNTGFDCSGFTAYLLSQVNIGLDHSSRSQGATGDRIELKDTRPGDLIVFRRSSRSSISHVAMVASNDEKGLFIIHSCSRGVVLENLYESGYWRPKVYMARDVISASLAVAVAPPAPVAAPKVAAEIQQNEIAPSFALNEITDETCQSLLVFSQSLTRLGVW